jgi:hypothetical protein
LCDGKYFFSLWQDLGVQPVDEDVEDPRFDVMEWDDSLLRLLPRAT